MQTSGNQERMYCFGGFTLDVRRGALLKDGIEVRLRAQSFQVLFHLVANHGRLVTRDELLEAIWGDTVVTDGSLTQCLIDVRRALGDLSRDVIRTVPRRGYIFESPVVEKEAPQPAKGREPRDIRGLRWPIAAALAMAIVVAAAWWEMPRDSPAVTAPIVAARVPVHPNSIAVLPFVDMSAAQDQEYFGDGISEEILNLLARFPDLQVIARTSSFSFKGRNPDIATIADTLHVAHVLEGSVRISGNRARITAQLVDAGTSAHLWSETYDRELGDVLAVQSEIAAAVAAALEVKLTAGAAAQNDATVNADAYEQFLQGRFFYNRRGPGDVERAGEYYRRALEFDPEYARAWAGLAGVYLVQIVRSDLEPEIGRPKWQEAVEQALKHGPELADSHLRATHYYWRTGEREKALEHHWKALALEPNNPSVLGSAANYNLLLGNLDQAIEMQQRAAEVDPLSSVAHGNLSQYLAAAGRFDEAKAEILKVRALSPTYSPDLRADIAAILILQGQFDEALAAIRQYAAGPDREQGLALVYSSLGRNAEAAAALQRLAARAGFDAACRVAEVYAHRGEFDKSFHWLAKAREEMRGETGPFRENQLHIFRVSAFLRPLHDDPRWDRLFVTTSD